jgi:2-oxoglutarate dehydrogenase E1 component
VSGFDAIARSSPDYVDALYRAYRRDPRAVDERWALVFAGYEFALRGDSRRGEAPAVADLVHSYRLLGHLVADLDPLGGSPRSHPLLRLADLGASETDLDHPVPPGAFPGLERGTVRDLLAALATTYSATLGVEYLGIPDRARREWLRERMEPARNRPALEPADRVAILERLMAAETFEQFLHAKFVGQKRFSLEGGEALIPLLDTIVGEAARLEVHELVMGMAHRGRLNVLAHTLQKPYEMILAEFEGAGLPPEVEGDGDVKYHLGYSHDHRTRDGRTIHLSLSPNPSHLEWVNPVVEGIVRAKQGYRGDGARRHVVPVLLHGDAAFMGQGVVYETLAMSELAGFTTGGTIHVVVNNQIGFTTAPGDYLFTRYPTGPANVIHAPVFHVNADDPEAAVQAARLAVGYRQAFGADVFIDFVCYRRHGHNELDDPTLTQPVLYEQIRNHPSVVELYRKRLAEQGLVDEPHLARRRAALRARLDEALATARRLRPRQQVFVFGGVWRGLSWAGDDWSARTGVAPARLRAIADALRRVPPNFTPHPRLRRLLDERAEHVARGEGLDWGTAETLAYGSLLLEGIPVRLSGQDTVRGTFSHRHAALFDAEDGHAWVPLNHLAARQAELEVVNSLLSEAAVLGFEYGMSSADPRRLVIWEAQFGDFVNAAQVILDQFIASGESKWQRMSGITLFLPHGYEGQGPEHSSARLERFLQLAAERNIQVIVPSTPAQLFHALRRQVHRAFRKPLVVMMPKSLLRHPRSVSTLADLTGGGFEPVLDDPAAGARRVLLCSGRIFFALDEARQASGRADVAIVRVEELYPFPEAAVRRALARHGAAREVVWIQEEPANQGAWSFVRPRLAAMLGDRPLRYVGRGEAASPATGSYHVHQHEEAGIVRAALDGAAAPDMTRRDGDSATGQAVS